ncbi:GFA family protein [uncultured Jannaschia sp.]|uniref:GFA family protein n=1 Tax=uncultured Jannaschia sp. TaxID=293347 RepID=UPI00262C7B29|nr:GFA family protein [uncultured Jannaschia sp.]
MTDTIEGRCLCGACRITVGGAHEAAVGACHCAMCQRWTGMFLAAFTAEAAAVRVEGPVTRHASSDFAERAFCATCGSHLWFRETGSTDADYELMPGLFREAADFPLTSEIYVDRRPLYATLSGDHARKTRAEVEAQTQFVEGDDP